MVAIVLTVISVALLWCLLWFLGGCPCKGCLRDARLLWVVARALLGCLLWLLC